MRVIKLDASDWKNASDFYAAILPALGAPAWHGKNVNALVESMVHGEINAIEPPFRVEIVGAQNCPARVRQELTWAAEDTLEAIEDTKNRWGNKPDVSFVVM